MNLYRFFKNTYTATFVIEIVSVFTLLIVLAFYGILNVVTTISIQIEVFLILVALGSAGLIMLLGINFFMRVRDKFLGVFGKEEEFLANTPSEKVVISIWLLSLIFFGSAIYYGLFLVFDIYIFPEVTEFLTWLIVFIVSGIVIVCFILQIMLLLMGKFTRKVVKQVLREPSSSSIKARAIVKAVPKEPSISSTPAKPIVKAVPKEPSASSTSGKPIVKEVPKEPSTSSTSGKPIVKAVPKEPSTSSTSGKPIVKEVKKEPSASSTRKQN